MQPGSARPAIKDHRHHLTPLAHCHTVWVLGKDSHEAWVEKIMDMCKGSEPYVFHLSPAKSKPV